MELGRLQVVRSGWAAFHLLTARLPFQIAFLFHQRSGSFDMAVCQQRSPKLDRHPWVGLHGPLDLPVLERSFEVSLEDIAAKLTGQPGSVDVELQAEINGLVKVPEGRDPCARWGGSSLTKRSQGQQERKSQEATHVRYLIRSGFQGDRTWQIDLNMPKFASVIKMKKTGFTSGGKEVYTMPNVEGFRRFGSI